MTSMGVFDEPPVDDRPLLRVVPPAPAAAAPRVAIVHDYLTQRGGAERVVLSLMQTFPAARLITSVYDPEGTFPEFRAYNVETTWINRIRPFNKDPRRALPLLPFVFSGVRLKDVDLVVCSSSGWAHGVRTPAAKIVYCHNPARWLYQQHEYVEEHGSLVRGAVRALSPYLRAWDRRAAQSAGSYLANSRTVAGRIEREYGRVADIVPPAVTIDPQAEQIPVEGLEPGFLLSVSRSRGYKNVQPVCEAVQAMPQERLVVVGGLPSGTWSDRLTGVEDVSDAQLRWLYAHCAAVVSVSFEDFGLAPVEGFAFGKPAVLLRAGGFLDTMVEGVSGFFISDASCGAVIEGIGKFRAATLPAEPILQHAEDYNQRAFQGAMHRTVAVAMAAHA